MAKKLAELENKRERSRLLTLKRHQETPAPLPYKERRALRKKKYQDIGTTTNDESVPVENASCCESEQKEEGNQDAESASSLDTEEKETEMVEKRGDSRVMPL